MKVVRVETRRLELRLSEPYTIAYEHIDHVENVLVRIFTDGRHHGTGCAAPDPEVTGETGASVVEALARVEPRVVGRDALGRARILEDVAEELRAAPSARAALDMALHDLLGKVAGLPLWTLLGGYRPSIATSVTIGILPEAETVARARDLCARGFRVLKLKGGRDLDDDVSRILAVRSAVGSAIELRFDANQGYDVDGSRRFVEATRAAELELVEQPVPRAALDALGAVTRSVHLPIMADESLLTLRDAFRLARGELADMINIKLMKVGGLVEARRVASVARAAKLEVMVGCMDESALAIAAGLAFALSAPEVVYADLDGHLDLLDDPTAGAVVLRDGELWPAEGAGLGLDFEF